MLSPDEATTVTIPVAPVAAVAAEIEPGPTIVVASNDGTPAAGATTTSSTNVVPLRSGVGGDIVGNSSNRLLNTTICLPLVYGSIAFFLGKKADEYHTHKWCLYLRGPNDEDLSVCIQKVVFQLHPSFAQPVRELTEPPFEVTERGWGEFEAQIRIVWKDPAEKATVVNHGIKLYPAGTTNMQPTKEPVVAEVYDEVVFTDPKESFFQSLMKVAEAPKIPFPDEAVQACFQHFSDEDEFQALLEAQKFLRKELEQVKARLKMCSDEMEQVDADLREVLEAKKAIRNSNTTTATAAPVKQKATTLPTTAASHVTKKQKT